MKKILFILLTAGATMATMRMCRAQATAQSSRAVSPVAVHIVAGTTSASAPLLNVHGLGADPAAVCAARNFWKTYGDAKGEIWYTLPGGFNAKFEEQGIRNSIMYDRRGNWLYTLKNYHEKELPPGIRARVKGEYYDYSISWVKEVTQPTLTNEEGMPVVVYILHLENMDDPSRWKTLRVTEEEMQVMEDFKRNHS